MVYYEPAHRKCGYATEINVAYILGDVYVMQPTNEPSLIEMANLSGW